MVLALHEKHSNNSLMYKANTFDKYAYNGIINCRLKKLNEYEWKM